MQAVRAADRLRELIAINRAITSSLDADEVLRIVAAKATELTRAEAAVLVVAGDGREPRTVVCRTGTVPAGVPVPLDAPLEARAVALLGTSDPARVLTVPLQDGDAAIGVLAVAWCQAQPAFARADDDFLLRALADQAVIALQHATALAQARAGRDAADQARRSLSAVLDAAPGGILLFSAGGAPPRLLSESARLIFAGQLDSLGDPVRRAALFRSPGGRVVRPEELPSVRALAGETVRGEVLVHKDAGGTERILESSAVPLRNADGVVEHALVAFEDATERRLDALEREQLLFEVFERDRWLENVFERSPGGLLLFEGTERPRLSANRRAEELFGRALVPADDPWTFREQLHAPDGRPSPLDLSVALAGKVVEPCELVIRRPDGTSLPVIASASPIEDLDGTVLGAAAVFEDIRGVKALERLREEWTSVVAHDLRQPLSAISGFASLVLRDEAVPPRAREHVEHIKAAAARLQRMTEDLLDASLIEARRLLVQPEPVALPELVQAVVARYAAGSVKNPIRVERRGPLPPIELDPDRLEQVLVNLLSNATKYGRPGTEIRVAVGPTGDGAEVAVSNEGPGIGPDELPLLFSRFHRLPAARRGAEPGLGLGLYLSKSLVEALGGNIAVESVPGALTTFRLRFPVDLLDA